MSAHKVEAAAAELPAWAGAAPDWRPGVLPPEPALPHPLSPSRPDGIRMGALPPARSPLARFADAPRPRASSAQTSAQSDAADRGVLIHTLLQYLPDLPEAARYDAAVRHTARVLPDDAGTIAQQVMDVLADPALAPLFGSASRAEQAVTGVAAGQVVMGRIDRVAILPDRILIADYKTARRPPASAAAIPVLYLRQMAAYRAVLAMLYPARPITCVLVWTETICLPAMRRAGSPLDCTANAGHFGARPA
jgi:ATP-dependent helicase/nuclease subunit A